ncbi:MAG: YigZ family protein [Bacteroidales bacterium]|nr:YigZ family protein [Paludibacteraceae bacterium]MBP8628391.1 YigZ family protein [Paludibacteraceae bacterium]MBP9648979.1 YigZ family protein [Paludibacteraceae bacterium]MBP9970275.1 YigZ family protein [Paludibacteraceae bacterium]NLK92904.1 YigZ family protein [Bacteroidales bacterium]
MQEDSYQSILQRAEGIYKEKGSKFLSFAIPVCSVDDAKMVLQSFRANYHDARHICYAYVIGYPNSVVRSSDDGEPSGTAGKPILAQIQAKQLSDVMVVVVRYFGGVLLGTGGLVVAYREATVDALNNTTVYTKIVEQALTIQCAYPQLNEVMKIIKDNNLTIISQTLEISCTLKVQIRLSNFEIITERLKQVHGLQVIEQI